MLPSSYVFVTAKLSLRAYGRVPGSIAAASIDRTGAPARNRNTSYM